MTPAGGAEKGSIVSMVSPGSDRTVRGLVAAVRRRHDDRRPRVRPRGREKLRRPIRRHDRVVVAKRDELAACGRESLVHAAGEAQVLRDSRSR